MVSRADLGRGQPRPSMRPASAALAIPAARHSYTPFRISIRPLTPIKRTSWKKLLIEVKRVVNEFGARTLVIGLPLRLDGTEGDAANEARRTAEKFRLSLAIPVHLQDERMSTIAAQESLAASGKSSQEIIEQIDSEAAAIILRDFINHET